MVLIVVRQVLVGMALALLASGCGESKYDVYMKGLEIEGEAERGPCKLQYAEGAPQATLSGDQVAWCLKETERALELYDKAASMGYEDAEFQRVHQRAKDRKKRLESMVEMVREMERDQIRSNVETKLTPAG